MMAIETMIEPRLREATVVQHVDRLIAETRDASLPDGEIASIVTSLRWLRNESIGQAGRRLVRRLGDRKYDGEGASKFFTGCYEMRSALVHGRSDHLAPRAIGSRAASLELFVGDLLSLELLNSLELA